MVVEIHPVWATNMSEIWVHLFECAINHFITRPFGLKGYKTALSYMTCHVEGLYGLELTQCHITGMYCRWGYQSNERVN